MGKEEVRYFVCGGRSESDDLTMFLKEHHNIEAENNLQYVGVSDEDAAFLMLTYTDNHAIFSATRKWKWSRDG